MHGSEAPGDAMTLSKKRPGCQSFVGRYLYVDFNGL